MRRGELSEDGVEYGALENLKFKSWYPSLRLNGKYLKFLCTLLKLLNSRQQTLGSRRSRPMRVHVVCVQWNDPGHQRQPTWKVLRNRHRRRDHSPRLLGKFLALESPKIQLQTHTNPLPFLEQQLCLVRKLLLPVQAQRTRPNPALQTGPWDQENDQNAQQAVRLRLRSTNRPKWPLDGVHAERKKRSARVVSLLFEVGVFLRISNENYFFDDFY